jgi:hypothetical protein
MHNAHKNNLNLTYSIINAKLNKKEKSIKKLGYSYTKISNESNFLSINVLVQITI